MTRAQLKENIISRKTFLCVGLDTDAALIPLHMRGKTDEVLTFNKAIIDATKDYCIAYKINTAFYESLGSKGWDIMQQTAAYIPSTHFKIADAKRADIGNTSAQYAKAFFETLAFDAVTVSPYMGHDSLAPFLAYDNKWTIVLGLTSNKGAADFEMLDTGNGQKLYQKVISTVASWGTLNNLMFVVGATQHEQFDEVRQLAPGHFLLVPGIGFQGGSLSHISEAAMNDDCGLLVNVSRTILYASSGEQYAAEAKAIALEYQQEMAVYLHKRFSGKTQ